MIKAKSHMVSMTLVITTALAGGAYASETKEIRIGLGAPLTGSNASYGKDLQNGVGLAVEQVNKTNPSIGGVPVKFVLDVEDDQGDARTAVTVAQKFIDNNVVAVIGHFNSGATMPASRLYDAAGIPMLTPASTNPGVTARGYKNVFRLLSNDDQMTTAAAGYVVNTLKATRIATLDDRTAFGQGEADLFAKKVTELGGKIVDQQFTNDKAVDFSAQLTHIKSSGADLIFFGGLDQQAALVAKKISQLGIKTQLMAGGAVADDLFIAVAGAAGEGTMAWETNAPLSTEGLGNKYLQDYKTRYGTQPLTFSPFAYDGANMVMQAVLSTGSTSGEELTKSLRSARYEGASGTIVFDDKGDRREAVNTLYQLKDGKFEVIATVKASN